MFLNVVPSCVQFAFTVLGMQCMVHVLFFTMQLCLHDFLCWDLTTRTMTAKSAGHKSGLAHAIFEGVWMLLA